MQTQVAPSVPATRIDDLRKFAATADLPPGKLRIVPLRGGVWSNGSYGTRLGDCVGVYELADPNVGSRSTLEFWIENERLAGKETVTDSGRKHARVLRSIKLDETGRVEFQPASYLEASRQKAENTIALSFSWSPQAETGKFIPGGFHTGTQKYRKL